jgi:hypothetical protein
MGDTPPNEIDRAFANAQQKLNQIDATHTRSMLEAVTRRCDSSEVVFRDLINWLGQHPRTPDKGVLSFKVSSELTRSIEECKKHREELREQIKRLALYDVHSTFKSAI